MAQNTYGCELNQNKEVKSQLMVITFFSISSPLPSLKFEIIDLITAYLSAINILTQYALFCFRSPPLTINVDLNHLSLSPKQIFKLPARTSPMMKS